MQKKDKSKMNAKERQKQDEMQKKGKNKENEKSQAFKDN